MQNSDTIDEAEVIIVGGGIMGISICYYLTKMGKKTILLEGSDLGSGASGACDQNIFIQSKNDTEDINLALKSKEIYENLAAELSQEDADIEYEQKGGLILIEDEEDLEYMTQRVKSQKRAGLEVEILDRDKIFEIYPQIPSLSSHVIAAAYCHDDAHVNTFKYIFALARKIEEQGGKIYLHTPVKDIVCKNGEIIGVATSRGYFTAKNVVNACGPYAPCLSAKIQHELSIKPRKGQIVVTQPLPEIVRGGVLSTKYLTAKHHVKEEQEFETDETDEDMNSKNKAQGLSFSQTKKGNLLIGATREFVGYDTSVSREGLQRILANAASIFPFLKKVDFIRAFSGLRPYSETGKPLIGKAGELEGYYICAGHEGDGISMAPITGKTMAELICGRLKT